MRGKSIALLALALGCGLVASLGITQVLSKRTEEAPPPDTQTVLVVTKDIGPNSVVTPDAVKQEQWPKDRLPEGTFTKPEDLEGRFTKVGYFPGEPVLEKKLLPKGSQPRPDRDIPKGFRVVSIPVEAVATNGGLILPGAHVDLQVVIHVKGDSGAEQVIARTVLQNICVFAVNDVLNSDAGKNPDSHSIQGRTVSFVVTPSEANLITLAAQMGTVRLILRSPDDKEMDAGRNAVQSDLLVGANSARKPSEDAPPDEKKNGFKDFLNQLQNELNKTPSTAKKAEAPRLPHHSIRVIKGGTVDDVEMENGDPDASGAWRIFGTTNVATSTPVADVPKFKMPAAPDDPALLPGGKKNDLGTSGGTQGNSGNGSSASGSSSTNGGNTKTSGGGMNPTMPMPK